MGRPVERAKYGTVRFHTAQVAAAAGRSGLARPCQQRKCAAANCSSCGFRCSAQTAVVGVAGKWGPEKGQTAHDPESGTDAWLPIRLSTNRASYLTPMGEPRGCHLSEMRVGDVLEAEDLILFAAALQILLSADSCPHSPRHIS